jgi:transposase
MKYKLNHETASKLTELWNSGVPKREIARVLGVSEGTVYRWVKELGLKPRQEQKHGYWSFKTLEKELKRVIDDLGHFPSCTELREMGRHDLVNVIRKYGGFHEVRRKMGYRSVCKPPNYWTLENLKKELEPIIEELGRFPMVPELTKMGRYDLCNAIRKHGGFKRLAKLMGRKRKGDLFAERLKKLWNEGLSQREIARILGVNEATVYKWVRKLGLRPRWKPFGYWEDFENLKRELENVIEELGRFPSQAELNRMGRSSIYYAICKHGGAQRVAERLGYKLGYRPPGYWTLENLKKELEPIVEKLGYLPSQKELKKMGRGDIAYAIQRRGGYAKVARELGFEPKWSGKPLGYWNNPENVDRAYDELKKKHGRVSCVMFERECPGAMTSIREGRYNPNIRTFRDYARHRGDRPIEAKRYELGYKASVLIEYFKSDRSMKRIAEERIINLKTIWKWSKKRDVLSRVASDLALPNVLQDHDLKEIGVHETKVTILLEKLVGARLYERHGVFLLRSSIKDEVQVLEEFLKPLLEEVFSP